MYKSILRKLNRSYSQFLQRTPSKICWLRFWESMNIFERLDLLTNQMSTIFDVFNSIQFFFFWNNHSYASFHQI